MKTDMAGQCCDLDEFVKAIADETRQRILILLQNGEMSVQELTEHLGLTQSTMSHHLSCLRFVHLVSARKVGRQTFYRANSACVAECSHAILERISPALADWKGWKRDNHHVS
jgi:DNA-binding transcriptional ArsR family regulator